MGGEVLTITHLFENKLATVTPLSNLVMVGTGASSMYDGRVEVDDDATNAAAAVDISTLWIAGLMMAGAAAIAFAVLIRRLASIWNML